MHLQCLNTSSSHKMKYWLSTRWMEVTKHWNTHNVIWLYQLSWKCKLATVTSYKADVPSVSPSSERMEELWVVCGFIWRKWSYAIGGNIATRKTWKLVEWKAGKFRKKLSPFTHNVILAGAWGDSVVSLLFLFQLLVFELEKCEVPDVLFVTEPKIIGKPFFRP